MIYLANPSTPSVRAAMADNDRLGCIITPRQGNRLPAGVKWCADNGLGPGRDGAPGRGQLEDDAWFRWLEGRVASAGPDLCLFAVAPDVVGDHEATLARSLPWLERVRGLDVPVAFVAQNGIEVSTWAPWDHIDVLFLGGDDAFKLGPHARELVAVATSIGKWVHMGRVNSEKRYEYARHIGCDSVDGTFLAFGPDANLPRVQTWLRGADQPSLFAA